MSEALAVRVTGVRQTGPPPLEFERAEKIATALYKGGITGGTQSKEGVLARIIAGHAVGLNEMASLTGIMVQGGKPSIFGNVLIGMVRQSKELVSLEEWTEGDGDTLTAFCRVVRKGYEQTPTVRRFSVADAKKAQLWNKDNWRFYPARMLASKPLAWALRDTFADVLMGMGIVEEMDDAEVVNVRQVADQPAPALPVAAPTPALPPAPPATGPTPATLQAIAAAREAWYASLGIDPDDEAAAKREWNGLLWQFKCKSARELTEADAANLLVVMKNQTEVAGNFDPAVIAREREMAFDGVTSATPAAKVAAGEVTEAVVEPATVTTGN